MKFGKIKTQGKNLKNFHSSLNENTATNADDEKSYKSTSYQLMKNLPEVLQNDIILQQLLHPKTSENFDFDAHPNVQKLILKEQHKENEIVKIEGNIVTQKVIGKNVLTYDKTKTIVESQWLNCIMDSKEPDLTESKDGIYIKHYNEVSMYPGKFRNEQTGTWDYQSATLASPHLLSHNFTNVFVYRPKEQIFNVDLNKNVIYPAPEASSKQLKK